MGESKASSHPLLNNLTDRLTERQISFGGPLATPMMAVKIAVRRRAGEMEWHTERGESGKEGAEDQRERCSDAQRERQMCVYSSLSFF